MWSRWMRRWKKVERNRRAYRIGETFWGIGKEVENKAFGGAGGRVEEGWSRWNKVDK